MPRFMKITLRLLAAAALAYLLACALLYARQREVMYQPQRTRVDAAQTNFSLQRPGITLRGWQYQPEQAAEGAPSVLSFGGNADNVLLTMPELSQALPQARIYTLAYRGYGASDGEPSEEALTDDAVALFDQVHQLHPHSPITVIGRSLGAAPAAAVAAARKPARLVLITPFDSMLGTVRDLLPWLPVSLLLKDRYDSAARLQRYAGPILVLRAAEDDLVRPARTDALLASLKGKAVESLTLPDSNHYDILQARGLWPAIREFVSGAKMDSP